MPSIYQEIEVRFRYPVHFTSGLFDPENPFFRDVVLGEAAGRGILLVVDEGVIRHCPALLGSIHAYCAEHSLRLAASPFVVPGGERVKNEHEWVPELHRAIHQAGLCRHSYVAAIGGGAVLDMAGLAAATAHRGVRLIRIPTTVLSQNDSAVGVKNGINAFGKKNFLGTFAPPHAVLIDFDFLGTLSDRDWRAGIAEAVKVALIRDAGFFQELERDAAALARRERAPMERLVYRSAELHLRHIAAAGDPFELGSARPLDFGHWAAHKLEQLSGHSLRHGEAVAIGIALDTTYSYLAGLMAEEPWQRVMRLLRTVGFALYTPELDRRLPDREHPACILRGLAEFREHLGGELTITLLRGIGRGVEVDAMDDEIIARSIAVLRETGPALVLGREPLRPGPAPGEPCRIHASEGDSHGQPIHHLSADAEAGDRRVLS